MKTDMVVPESKSGLDPNMREICKLIYHVGVTIFSADTRHAPVGYLQSFHR